MTSLCYVASQRILELLEAFFFNMKRGYLMVSKKTINYLCENVIEKSVLHDQSLSSLGKPRDATASLVIPNGDPRDGFLHGKPCDAKR